MRWIWTAKGGGRFLGISQQAYLGLIRMNLWDNESSSILKKHQNSQTYFSEPARISARSVTNRPRGKPIGDTSEFNSAFSQTVIIS
jgi:hypothetical protein